MTAMTNIRKRFEAAGVEWADGMTQHEALHRVARLLSLSQPREDAARHWALAAAMLAVIHDIWGSDFVARSVGMDCTRTRPVKLRDLEDLTGERE